MSDMRVVYSTDPNENRRCPKCKELASECRCRPDVTVDPSNITALLRIEKSGRRGKTVTVIDRLPRSDTFLKALTRKLKKCCGAGGSHKLGQDSGAIEIQGDKRDAVRALLTREGIAHKG